MDESENLHRKSALQVFGLIGLTVITALAGFVLAFIGAIVISRCIGDCTTRDPAGGIPYVVGAALAGGTSATSAYWMVSTHHPR